MNGSMNGSTNGSTSVSTNESTPPQTNTPPGPAPADHDAAYETPGALLGPGSSNDGDAQILAAMDRLRELGIAEHYDLPQIIVCGSQSAGKSSVLESLVKVPFPRGENTCTRYVTKVTIKPAAVPSVEVAIEPGEDRPPDRAAELRRFCRQDASSHYDTMLDRFMADAHAEIFKAPGQGDLITKDILTITVRGPGTRPLQVLDLPGLIAYEQTTSGNEAAIEEMVAHYMAMEQSFILAVIKANDDLSNHKILKLCERHDQLGKRTLGIITRPDVAEPTQARKLISVMQGKDASFQFKYGWHVVRNRSSEERGLSQAQRDRREDELLGRHPWNQVDESFRGIEQLRKRLRERLFNHAKQELPRLCKKFRDRLWHLQDQFARLGGDEMEEGRLQSVWDEAMDRLYNHARDHSRGKYESDIAGFDYNGAVRLRARVADQSEVFRDKLVADGHLWTTLIRPKPPDPDDDLRSVYKPDPAPVPTEKKTHASLDAEVAEVAQMLKQMRGTELPTFFNPEHISQLFWRMSKSWEAISRDHIEQIYLCCKRYFHDVTPEAFRHKARSTGKSGFSNAAKIAERLVVPYIVPRLDECKAAALDELTRLELDRLDFLSNADIMFLKDVRNHREGRGLARAVKAYTGIAQSSSSPGARLDQTTYALQAELHTRDELTADTAEMYISAMWSHYLV